MISTPILADSVKLTIGCFSESLKALKSCSIESGNDQCPKSEVVHQPKFTSVPACLLRTVSQTLEF